VPGGGSDIALDLLCLSAGAALGAAGGLATHLRAGADGRPLGRAGVLAASMWLAGVGARMIFYFAATHGAGPAIAAFSVAHHITGPGAWTAALVMMALADVLTRLAVVYLRGRRLTPGTPVLAAPAQATSRPGPSRPHRGRSDGPASVPAAHVRSRARAYQHLAAAGNAPARPAMPRHRRAALSAAS
jgi:hypothetical protein